MRICRAGWILALAILWAAPGMRAQTFGNPFDTAVMRNYWNPIAGAGAAFNVTGKDGKKRTEEWDILSEETVDGKKAYWLGFSVESADFKGRIDGKILVIPDGYQAIKMIIQFPGMAAMDMPVADDAQNADTQDTAKLVGTERITVPGGTFECEHWREANGAEAWVSAKVGPIKVVKSVERDQTRVLVRTVSAPKDAITGPVKDYDPDVIKRFAQKQSKSP
jgi:hypothetical protein